MTEEKKVVEKVAEVTPKPAPEKSEAKGEAQPEPKLIVCVMIEAFDNGNVNIKSNPPTTSRYELLGLLQSTVRQLGG